MSWNIPQYPYGDAASLEAYYKECEELDVKFGSDFRYALEYNSCATPSARPVECLAYIEGAHDGPAYHWLLKLEDGTHAYLTGGCDYTGWDCRSSAEIYEAPTLTEILALVPEAERSDFQREMDARERGGA